MTRAFQALWLTTKDLLDEFLVLMVCNGIWSVISLPLILLALFLGVNGSIALALGTLLLSVLPMAPATAGLYYMLNRLTEGYAIKISDLFSGMRRYAIPAWKNFGFWMLGLIVILINLQFYNAVTNVFTAILVLLWFYALLVWLSLLIYLFPLLMLQSNASLRLTARNVFVMTLGRPFFTVVTMMLMSIVVAINYVLPFLAPIVTVVFLALWSMRATRMLVAESEARRTVEQPATPPPKVEQEGRRRQARSK